MRYERNSLLIAAIALLFPLGATAQEGSPPAIKSRFQLNTYDLPTAPSDGFALDHAAVLDSLQFGFTALIQVDDDPLTWQREAKGGGHEETAVGVGRLIALHLGGALGLFKYGELGVAFPVYLDSGVSSAKSGAGDLRLVPKGAYRLPAGKAELGFALLVPISLPTGDETGLMGEGVVGVAPGLAFDVLLARLRLLLNAGYYWREEEDADIVRGAEILLGLGAELEIMTVPNSLKAIVEARLSTQTADAFGRTSTPADVLAGVKFRFENGIGLLAAGGAGVSAGIGAPDFRAVFGIDYIWQRAEEEEAAAGEETKQIDDKDSDGDGVMDSSDHCPEEAEDYDKFEDDDGCPDSDNDGDGVPDIKDPCPIEPENVNGMDDDDGCPDSDNDGDGVSDKQDRCPTKPEDRDGFADEDGCPDEDNDLDGVADAADACPDLPESQNGVKDDDGCPDYFALSGDKVEFKRKLAFVKGTDELTDESFDVLEELTSIIIANPAWTEVRIAVHLSGRGKEAEAQALSEKRAATLLRLLVAGGIVPERLTAAGRGNSEPLASPDTPDGRRQNERVEMTIKRGGAR